MPGRFCSIYTKLRKIPGSADTYYGIYDRKIYDADSSTRRNLELCETLREKQKRGSLLWVLDKTKTAMGARMLRKYVEQPLIEKKKSFGGWMLWRN